MTRRKKYLRKTFTFNGKRYEVRGKTKKEVESNYLDKLSQLENGNDNTSSITVSEWSRICIETYKSNLTPKGLENTNNWMRSCVLKYMGDVKIEEVTPLMCQKTINMQKGKSNCQINITFQLLNFIFDLAVLNDLITKNPAEKITKPLGKPYKPRRALTNKEEQIFLIAVKQHHYAPYFMLIYGCGCRPSEAAKVEIRDIVVIDGRRFLHIRGTKSENADRYVPLPIEVERHFQKSRDPNQRVCLSNSGTPLNKQNMERAWRSLERDMNILMGCKVYRNKLIPPYPLASDLSTYCLRHTYCTNLKKKGVDIRTAQYLMGHSDIRITANIYTDNGIETIMNEYDLVCGTQKKCGK